LKAAWFQPLNLLREKNWFQNLLSNGSNCTRYAPAVLSTTAKAKAKAKKKDALKAAAEGGDAPAAMEEDAAAGGEGAAEGMDVDEKKMEGAEGAEGEAGEAGEGAEKEKAKEPEPTKEELANPARVTPAQERYVRFDDGSRFVPIAAGKAGKAAPTRGFVVMRDTTPGEEVEYVTSTRAPPAGVAGAPGAAAAAAPAAEEEPAPPEAFEFDPNEV
jgi:26S proteasome regulatory subunit N2